MGDILSALTLEPPSGPWTADDYFAQPASSTKVELQDGCYVVSPASTPRHQFVETQLILAIARAGRMALPESDVRLSDTSVRRPDLVLLRPGVVAGTDYPGSAEVELVVEIVSPSSARTDRLLKPTEYAEAGIPGFWLVELDPEVNLTAFLLDGDSYRSLGTWGAGDVARITEPFAVDVVIDALTQQ